MRLSTPLAYLILGSAFQVRTDTLGVLIGLMILSALAATSLGLAFGTAVKPEQIGVLNAVILTPIMFTGCAFLSLGIRGFIEER